MTIRDEDAQDKTNAALLCALGAVVMAYGWGYRGVVGHEGGAMIPGAMLGMAVCLASTRPDWHRRAVIAGMLTAIGFAWGGSISYMEHPKYILSDSFPDVLYGYCMLFFFGGIWAGMGGALLGMALTEPRSKLYLYLRPFVILCGVYLGQYLFFLFNPNLKDALDLYVAREWNDSEVFAALTALIVSIVYWFAYPPDRKGTALIFWCSVGWWIGYGGLTKLGGIEIAPPARSESWGGVLGILVIVMIYLWRQHNRAALLLAWYGIVGGGLAFALGVFLRHPVELGLFGMNRNTFLGPWKVAEEGFGFFMGLALSFGALRLLRGGLEPPREDAPSGPLNVFAAFVVLIALMWMNLRRAPMGWLDRWHSIPDVPVMGMRPWLWFFLAGCVFTSLTLYGLYQQRKHLLAIAPPTPYGKAVLVFLFLLWMPVVGSWIQHQVADRGAELIITEATFWIGAALATWLVMLHTGAALNAPTPAFASALPSDKRWRPGIGFFGVALLSPLILWLLAVSSMAMMDAPKDVYRYRFGENAFWRQFERLVGTWEPRGIVASSGDTTLVSQDRPVVRMVFDDDNGVTVTWADGKVEEGYHRWWPAGAWITIQWYEKAKDKGTPATSKLEFKEQRMYFSWPPESNDVKEGSTPTQGFLYLERVNDVAPSG